MQVAAVLCPSKGSLHSSPFWTEWDKTSLVLCWLGVSYNVHGLSKTLPLEQPCLLSNMPYSHALSELEGKYMHCITQGKWKQTLSAKAVKTYSYLSPLPSLFPCSQQSLPFLSFPASHNLTVEREENPNLPGAGVPRQRHWHRTVTAQQHRQQAGGEMKWHIKANASTAHMVQQNRE